MSLPKAFTNKVILPKEISENEKSLAVIKDFLESKGYQKIITPSFDYLDNIKKGLSENLLKRTIKLFDSEGNIVVLRPDFTVQIAKLTAERLKEYPKPIKLYYCDNIYRRQIKKQEAIETMQIGMELIGLDGPEIDAQVIVLGIQILQKLGFKKFAVDIGHTDFVTSFSKEKKQALIEEDYVQFGSIPEKGKDELISDQPNLLTTYQILKDKGLEKYVNFNKGLIKDLNYYTGIMFEFYIDGIGSIVGSGGRYNNLIKKFGYDLPSIGFSFDINKILNY